MKPRICICCGDSIEETANALSRNPNVCASCSSLADGMDDHSALPELDTTEGPPPSVVHPASDITAPGSDEIIVPWPAETATEEVPAEKVAGGTRKL